MINNANIFQEEGETKQGLGVLLPSPQKYT